MHSKRDEPNLHVWPDKQTLGNVLATLQCFYFDQHSGKILQAYQKSEFFFFFVDWNIADACLLFEAPTQLGMMIDDTVRLVCVFMLLLTEIFR